MVMSKGDWKRPIRDRKTFDENWERIWGKRADTTERPEPKSQERAKS
jgi:hypothetical protein